VLTGMVTRGNGFAEIPLLLHLLDSGCPDLNQSR